MSVPHVLCVDPDETARAETIQGLHGELADLAVETTGAGSLADAEAVLERGDHFDCVVTEYDLPDGTGLALAERVRAHAPDAGCILFTARDRGKIDTGRFPATVAEYVDRGTEGAIGRLAGLVRITVSAGAQTSYPVPQHEAERIAALESYDLDAAGLEESLARITDLATRHFDAPAASINVIGKHRQEFLACHGTSETWGQTSREDSICTFTIVEDDPVMVVEDVTADPRFEHNETLAELGIRAYMGADVDPAGGPTIGTLCVYDEEPRSFSSADRTYLRTLAEVAADLIDAYARPDRQPAPDRETPGEGAVEDEGEGGRGDGGDPP